MNLIKINRTLVIYFNQ